MRLAVVGSGPWSERYISTIKNSGLYAEPIQISARILLDLYDRDNHTGDLILDLLRELHVDGVIFATRTQTQEMIAPHLIRNSIPVILEKPIVSYIRFLKDLDSSVTDTSIVFANFSNLFCRNFNELKKLKDCNHDVSFRMINGGYGPFRSYLGPYDDWAPHCISAAQLLFGEPNLEKSKIREIVSSNNPDGLVYDCHLFFCKNNVSNLIFGNGMQRRVREYELIKSRRSEVIKYSPHDSSNLNFIEIEKDFPLENLVVAFIKQIAEKDPHTLSFIHAKQVATTMAYLKDSL
jgi:predicted dehydrogenase